MKIRTVFLPAGILFMLTLCSSSYALATNETSFTVAVVQDGTGPCFDQLVEMTRRELIKLTDGEFNVHFDTAPEYNAGWQHDQIEKCLNAALVNTNIDLILAAGYLTAEAAANPDKPLRIPVISGFTQDTDLYAQPLNELGHSTKTNYTFVLIPRSSKKDIKLFAEMISFTNLGILVDTIFMDNPAISHAVKQYENQADSRITLIPVDTSAADVIAGLNTSIDAVYLTPPLRMSASEWDKIITACNNKKIPSFSMMGQYDVKAGALAGAATHDQEKLARRLALNIQQIMLGTPPEQLYVPMKIKEELIINAKTAKLLDVYPPFDILMRATYINEEYLNRGKPINIDQAMVFALENNAPLAIERASVEIMKQDRNKSLSPLLPQLEGNGNYSRIDDDRARASMGTQPREKTTVGLQASQVIFNDPALTGYRAYERYYKGSVFNQEGIRLDTLLNASTAYISLLQAQALSRIQRENLKLTLSNLDLAQIRHNVGTAGPEEVYRWQAQAAQDKASYLSALSVAGQAQIALNRVLGYPLDSAWSAKDISNGDSLFLESSDKIGLFLQNEKQKAEFDRLVVKQSLKRSPELQALDQQIEARRLLLNQSKRRFVLPEFGASFNLDHTVDEDFIGQTTDTDTDDDTWLLGIQASLPLFQGADRIFSVTRESAELMKLLETRRNIAEQIEQRARNILYSIESTQPSMLLQKEAAEYSEKNYTVVKDKYARGVVSILDLLDAQNQAFVANQNATIARYSFLFDLYELQRSLCWFESEHTPEERKTWVKNIENAVQK